MSDVFRKVYKPLTDEQKAQVDAVKDKAQELFDLIDSFVPAGERSERARLVNAGKTGIEMYMAGGIVKGLTTVE